MAAGQLYIKSSDKYLYWRDSGNVERKGAFRVSPPAPISMSNGMLLLTTDIFGVGYICWRVSSVNYAYQGATVTSGVSPNGAVWVKASDNKLHFIIGGKEFSIAY